MSEKLSKKCIVMGCENHSHEGRFIGDLCAPCHASLVSGRIPRPIRKGREMYEMLRSMQSGELTVSRGVELVDMWLAGNYTDDQLPPARNELEIDEMPWDRIDKLTGQLAAIEQHFDDAVDCARLLGSTFANKRFGCFNDQDSRFVHAMYESIAKHRREALGK